MTEIPLFYQLALNFVNSRLHYRYLHIIIMRYKIVSVDWPEPAPDIICRPLDNLLGLFCCPIGLTPIETPVIAVDGYVYEKTYIQDSLACRQSSPIMGAGIKMGAALKPASLFASLSCFYQ